MVANVERLYGVFCLENIKNHFFFARSQTDQTFVRMMNDYDFLDDQNLMDLLDCYSDNDFPMQIESQENSSIDECSFHLLKLSMVWKF